MNGCASVPFEKVNSAAMSNNHINSIANTEDRSQKKLRRKNAIRRNNKSDYESTSEDSTTNDMSEDTSSK